MGQGRATAGETGKQKRTKSRKCCGPEKNHHSDSEGTNSKEGDKNMYVSQKLK